MKLVVRTLPSLLVGRGCCIGLFSNEPFMQKEEGLFSRALPRKKTSRERRSRREPEKNGRFGTLITHFLRETPTHMMRVSHSGLCEGPTYLLILPAAHRT